MVAHGQLSAAMPHVLGGLNVSRRSLAACISARQVFLQLGGFSGAAASCGEVPVVLGEDRDDVCRWRRSSCRRRP